MSSSIKGKKLKKHLTNNKKYTIIKVQRTEEVQKMYDRYDVANWLMDVEPELTVDDALYMADEMILEWVAEDEGE